MKNVRFRTPIARWRTLDYQKRIRIFEAPQSTQGITKFK